MGIVNLTKGRSGTESPQVTKYSSFAAFPVIGDVLKLYLDEAEDIIFSWDGSEYQTTSLISGRVNTYADLPLASSHSGQVWAVLTTFGGYDAGLYSSDGIIWSPFGLFAVAFSADPPIYYNNITGNFTFSWNATNLKLTSNALNTIQDIATSSSPTFSGLTLNGLTVSKLVSTDSSKNLISSNLSGDITTSGLVTTLATVNPNVGTFGSATQVAQVIVNGKGLITGVSNVTISGVAPGGSAGGDLSGTYPNPTVAKINGVALGTTTATSGNILIGSGSTWVTNAVSGDATLSSVGALTLATVNSNVGSFGSSTSIPSFTVNAKGLITAASGNVVIAPAGTLTGATLAAGVTASSLTSVGTIATGIWQGTIIGLTYGGSNANLTASNGGIVYSTASAMAILAGTATANQMLQSRASTAPAWSTATWPTTTTINQLLYSSAANVVGGITAANYGVLISSSSGVPSWLANGTTGQVLTATTSGTPSWASITSGVSSVTGTSNQIGCSPTTGAVVVSLTNGISIGSYQSTTPPTGGIIAPGRIGVGLSSPNSQAILHGSGTSGNANVILTASDQGADNKHWGMGPNSTSYYGYIINDAFNTFTNWLQVIRSGNSITNIVLNATTLNFGGTIISAAWNANTITVAYGGTGATSFTAYSLICAGTTSTGNFQNVSGVGTAGQTLTSNGAGALPTWQSISTLPVFLRWKQTTNQSISAATWTKISLNTTSYDTISGWDTFNNRYTPNVAGYYLFVGSVISGNGANTFYLPAVYLNGTAVMQGNNFPTSASAGPNSQVVFMISMNGSTDYVELWFFAQNATTINASIFTMLQGFLIR